MAQSMVDEEVKRLLNSINLGEYEAIFSKNGCNSISTVLQLTSDDFKELIPKVGHRRLIINATNQYKKNSKQRLKATDSKNKTSTNTKSKIAKNTQNTTKTKNSKNKTNNKASNSSSNNNNNNSNFDNINFKYKTGDTVLCLYSDRKIYEAKILESKNGSRNEYLLHFKGWNKKWDIWAAEASLFKASNDNLGLMKQINELVTQQFKQSKQNKQSMSENDDINNEIDACIARLK